jgi:G3E family GTPase
VRSSLSRLWGSYYAPEPPRLSMPSLFANDNTEERTPVFVLTGFLGSGKTTLLNRLLRDPALADTAVIVNELGDVALDHLLVERLEGEVALLRSGCICCAVRGDFEDTLRELLARRDEGSLPPFARVIVETTGLADPAPLVQAVETNPLLAHFCRLGAVLTTVDTVNAPSQLQHQWEARKQVALADRLLITKSDLAPPTPALVASLQALNPLAERCRVDAHDLPRDPPRDLPRDLLSPIATHQSVRQTAGVHGGLLGGRPMASLNGPHGEVHSFVLQADSPLDWPRLQQWLAMLRARHGERLLRLKAVVRVSGEPAPLVLHGVQHLFHPPLAAPRLEWPEGRSALVFIVRGLDAGEVRAGFEACIAS